MIYAEKGNRVRQINESEIQQYVEQGYKITNGRGTVLKETVPTDVMSLRLAYQKHTAEIEDLKKQLAQLTSENEQLKAKAPKAKAEPVVSDEETKDAPKKRGKANADKVEE